MVSAVSVMDIPVWMVGEEVSALTEIVNWPPLTTALWKKIIGVLLVLAAGVPLVEVLEVICG